MAAVADLHSKILDAPPPPRGSKFIQFHAVFGKIWQNRMLAPPWRVGAPSSGKSWIHHWAVKTIDWLRRLTKIADDKITDFSILKCEKILVLERYFLQAQSMPWHLYKFLRCQFSVLIQNVYGALGVVWKRWDIGPLINRCLLLFGPTESMPKRSRISEFLCRINHCYLLSSAG